LLRGEVVGEYQLARGGVNHSLKLCQRIGFDVKPDNIAFRIKDLGFIILNGFDEEMAWGGHIWHSLAYNTKVELG
jgi:hypothetical protein